MSFDLIVVNEYAPNFFFQHFFLLSLLSLNIFVCKQVKLNKLVCLYNMNSHEWCTHKAKQSLQIQCSLACRHNVFDSRQYHFF
mmetsp:Transcript_69799/g.110958  ORF Transcript_69799/g.110958 Transcript_69799/m.110958 type:complete len:83 (-) Transcript_69799:2228-2476(-)